MPGICLADVYAVFHDSSFINDNSGAQFTYTWNFGDVNSTPANPDFANVKNPQHAYTATGVYPVHLTVASKDGCVADTMKSFTVNGSQPVAGFNIAGGDTICSNLQLTVSDASTVNFGDIIRVELWWDYDNDPALKIVDSFPLAGKQYMHRYQAFGSPLFKQVRVRYLVYSGISCVNELRKSITLLASPAIAFAPLPGLCAEEKPLMLAAAESTGLAGNGIYSGPGISGNYLFDPSKAGAGDHVIRYTFNADNGCTAFAEQAVKVFASPVINAGPDRAMLRGGSIVIDANATGNNLQYEWTPDVAIENNQVEKPAVSPAENTLYLLKVVSADGCVATDDVLVTVYKDIFVPTAFSPNGDGINDTWRIPFLNSYTGAEVKVYNRYGQLVYLAAGSEVNWDGRFKGKPLPSGSYVWMISIASLKKFIHGSVMMVR